MRTLLTTGNLALGTAQLRFRSLIPAGIGNRFVIRQGGELLQPNVHTNFVGTRRQWLRRTRDGEEGVPLATFTLEGDGRNLAYDSAMQLRCDLSDAVNAKRAVSQLDASPVTWKRNAVEATTPLESRIAS